MRPRSTAVAAVVLTLALLGCDEGPTQLVVVVDSNLRVPDETDGVEARVLTPEGQRVSSHEFTLVSGEGSTGPARFALPLSFGVVPLEGDPDRRVAVEVSALSAERGDRLVTRRAVTGFLAHKTLRLPMFLARSCRGVDCGPGKTCTREGCVEEEVPPEELPIVEPGEEFDDAGTTAEAGLDGSTDGGTAGDGSPGDAASGSVFDCPSSCDGGCREITCDASTCTCEQEPCNCALKCAEATCDTRCNGSTCTVDGRRTAQLQSECVNETRCRIDARGSSSASVQCESGSRCAVDCSGASDCSVECSPGAKCRLTCEDANGCAITACTGMIDQCDDGSLVCNRNCP